MQPADNISGVCRLTDFRANSWRLNCFSHSITTEMLKPAR